MQALTPQRLARSAYRTLGLSASATQQQIDAAARRLRIWPDPNTVPPTAWDSPWLGPVNRTRNDIEQAVAALHDPGTRVEERLLWFHGQDPSIWSAANVLSPDGTIQKLAAARDPASVHDIVLVRLQLAMLHDCHFLDANRWKRVLAQLNGLSRSRTFQEWAEQLEAQGDFEKRAQSEEVSASVHSLPQLLADTMATRAEAALEDDDPKTAGRILGLLRNEDGSLQASGAVEKRILDRLEDLITRRCGHLQDDLSRKFTRGGTPMELARATCGGCAKFYNDSIDPVLGELYALAGAKSDRALRGRSAAARAMEYLGRCWAASARYTIAEKTLEAALELGAGTTFEATILASLERCRESARRAPPPTSFSSAGRRNVQYAGGGSGSSSAMWRGAAIIIGIMLGLGRVFSGFNSSSSNYTPTPTYNIPQYTSPNGPIRFSPDGRPMPAPDPGQGTDPWDNPRTNQPGVGPTGMPTFHH